MNTIPQPSTKSLIISCLLSIIIAVIVFTVAVLPAEYNIDPTGLGKSLGLTVLSQTGHNDEHPIISSCADETLPATESKTQWQDSVTIRIPANKGLEYKFNIVKGESLDFVWKTEKGEKLYFDFHGDPDGAINGYFKSYKESTQNQSSGTLEAPFTGKHGWYWQNKTNNTVIISLKTRGNYKIIGLI